MSKPQVSQSLKILEEKGYTTRKQDIKNNKYTRLYISKTAEQLLEELVEK